MCEQKSKPFPQILADKHIINILKQGLPEGSSISEFGDSDLSNPNLVFVGEVVCINGDAAKIIKERLENKGDRTLMLLPERSDEFLESAILATRNNGIIHYYSHIHADKKQDAPKLSEQHYLELTKVKSEILNSKIVRAVGPRYYQTVVDVKITK